MSLLASEDVPVLVLIGSWIIYFRESKCLLRGPEIHIWK